MNKNKFYTIGLIASSLLATSCDDRLEDCGCNCNMPEITSWKILKEGTEKNADGTVNAGTAVVIYGKNLSDITAITFGNKNAELHPSFMEDNKIVFQVPDGISRDCMAHITTAYCSEGFDTDLLRVVVAPPCVSMCDNEMAETTLNIVGNSFFAPLTAKFWDGEDHTIEASTEDGTIKINNQNEATITLPKGIVDGGTILFISDAGEYETDFRFRDTRNMLITHDDEEYLNKFNQEVPDAERVDEETGMVIGLPKSKEEYKNTIFHSENNTTNFSIFHDLAGYTAWTYSPTGTANPEGVETKYATPFGVFSESIESGETTFNDYVIKFEVFVPKENPIQGNGFAIAFYNNAWQDIRKYCAFWQPSIASFDKNEDNSWKDACTCSEWHSNGDWITVTIPFEELKYDFASCKYTHSAQNDRLIPNDEEHMYDGFGDKEEGLPMFENGQYSKLASKLTNRDRTKNIQSIGIEMGNADQPNTNNRPLIGVDNLRVVPKDNNGCVWHLLKWGRSTRDCFSNYPTSCNK